MREKWTCQTCQLRKRPHISSVIIMTVMAMVKVYDDNDDDDDNNNDTDIKPCQC